MPLRSGNMYLLGEFSKFSITTMDSQLVTTLTAIETKFDALTQIMNQTKRA